MSDEQRVLGGWLLDALEELGGRGTIVEVCRIVWRDHEPDLRDAGNLFYRWQYVIRWSALNLRKKGKLKPVERASGNVWELTSGVRMELRARRARERAT
jgi:hypothetical protein